MAYAPIWLRQLVEERAGSRCEYCSARKRIVMSLEIDHVIPVSSGGETRIDNLCLAYSSCNGFKSAFVTGPDPETGKETRLFHPRTDNWRDHIAWSVDGTRMLGLTAVGRATIARLRLNRPDVLDTRKIWAEAGWHPPSWTA